MSMALLHIESRSFHDNLLYRTKMLSLRYGGLGLGKPIPVDMSLFLTLLECVNLSFAADSSTGMVVLLLCPRKLNLISSAHAFGEPGNEAKESSTDDRSYIIFRSSHISLNRH